MTDCAENVKKFILYIRRQTALMLAQFSVRVNYQQPLKMPNAVFGETSGSDISFEHGLQAWKHFMKHNSEAGHESLKNYTLISVYLKMDKACFLPMVFKCQENLGPNHPQVLLAIIIIKIHSYRHLWPEMLKRPKTLLIIIPLFSTSSFSSSLSLILHQSYISASSFFLYSPPILH